MAKSKSVKYHWNPNDYVPKQRLIDLVKAWRRYAKMIMDNVVAGVYTNKELEVKVVIEAKAYRKAANTLTRRLK